ncbi:MAG: tyrosine-protein kinase family protein [Terriglobales bacterium]
MSRVFEALQKANAEVAAAAPAPAPAGVTQDPVVMQPHALDVAELEKCHSFSVASIPQNRLVALNDDNSLGAEKIRVLTTRLRHLRHKRRLSKILVTSSMAGEGKSVISTNLAISIARHSRARTLLIDGDLRKPTDSKLLGLENGPDVGIAKWWTDNVSPLHLLRRAENLSLWFLPAGYLDGQPLEIIQSQRMAEMFNQLGSIFEWIIVDSPPMMPLADSAVWASLTDATLFVVRENFTSTKLFRQSVESFDSNKLVGVVVNESVSLDRRYYNKYYYRYGKEEGSE